MDAPPNTVIFPYFPLFWRVVLVTSFSIFPSFSHFSGKVLVVNVSRGNSMNRWRGVDYKGKRRVRSILPVSKVGTKTKRRIWANICQIDGWWCLWQNGMIVGYFVFVTKPKRKKEKIAVMRLLVGTVFFPNFLNVHVVLSIFKM